MTAGTITMSPSSLKESTSWSTTIVAPIHDLFFEVSKVLKTNTGVQRVGKLILNGASFCYGPGAFPKMENRLTQVDAMFDAVGIFGDVDRVLQGEYSKDIKEGKWAQFMAYASLFVADIGGTLLWVKEFAPEELAAVANAIGKVSLFGKTPLSFVPQISLPLFSIGAAMVGFSFIIVDLILSNQLFSGDQKEACKAWLSLAYCVAELAAKVLFLTGASMVTISAAGVVAALIGIGEIIYTEEPKKKQNKGV